MDTDEHGWGGETRISRIFTKRILGETADLNHGWTLMYTDGVEAEETVDDRQIARF